MKINILCLWLGTKHDEHLRAAKNFGQASGHKATRRQLREVLQRAIAFACIVFGLFLASNLLGASYYIDYVSGSDANTGTSTGAAWKRHPFMRGWTGIYAHAAGDRFVFKGGVTWPKEALPLTVTVSGTSGNRDYYGVSNNWYSGGSWTRPVFDAEYTTNSTLFSLSSVSGNLTIDGIEMKRLTCSANYGPGLITGGTGSYVTITNCYLHGWRLDPAIATDDAHGGIIFGWGNDFEWTIRVESCEIENSENTNRWNGVAVRRVGTIKNSRIHDNSSAVLFCLDYDGNEMWNIAYPYSSFDATYHLNGVYLQPSLFTNSTGYIRNSKFYDMGGGANMAYPNPANRTVYVYNNLFYGVMSVQLAIEIDPYGGHDDASGGTVYCYNNTIVNYFANSVGIHCVNRGVGNRLTALTAYNNHVIGTNATLTDAGSGTVASITTGYSLIQSVGVAASQNYTFQNRYAATLSGATIGAGTNAPASVFTNDILGVTRSGTWDIGTYEYSSNTGPYIVTQPASQSVPTNANVTFTVAVSGTSPLAYQWQQQGTNIPNANTSSCVINNVTTNSAGSFCVIVSNAFGSVTSSVATLTVTNRVSIIPAPVISAITQNAADLDLTTPGIQLYAGTVVQYSGSASDPSGYPLTWQWLYALNGGPETVVQIGSGTVAAVSYSYTTATAGNSYLWKLRVGNGYSTAESTLGVGVVAPPPVAGGFIFQASGGDLTAPLVLTNGYLSQSVQTTDPAFGGRAAFTFTVINAGNYVIKALVNASSDGNNSFFVNLDGEPLAPTMIWDIPITSGFEQRIVSWRGSGSDVNNEFVPKSFAISAGTHQLIVRGREANVQLQTLGILWQPASPSGVRLGP